MWPALSRIDTSHRTGAGTRMNASPFSACSKAWRARCESWRCVRLAYQIRGCVSVTYTDTQLLLGFRVMQLFSAALNRVANQLSDVLRCSFQIANLGDRTGQRCSFRQLLEEGFNQSLPLL